MADFTVYNAEVDELPVVIDFPHSGTSIPAAIQRQLIPEVKLTNVDWFLPDLYDFLMQNGLTTLENNLHRYVADPNRDSNLTDLDGDYRHEVVYSHSIFGKQLYSKNLTPTEIEQRLIEYYRPYHQQLQQLIDHKLQKFDKVYLFDLHSFAGYPGDTDAAVDDIVLGNKSDMTSSSNLRDILTEQFQQKGYTVSDNYPFSGGYITQHYGQDPRVEAVQIELSYHMYIENRYFGEEELNSVDVGTFTTAKNSLQSIFLSLLNYVS